MIRSIIHRVIKRVAKQVSKNHLFEQPHERKTQQPIFTTEASLVKLSTFQEIEEAMLGARLINHWATWCAPCVEELDVLARIQEAVGAENMLGISWELFQGESFDVAASEVKKTAESMGLKYPHHLVENNPEAFFKHFDLSDQVVPQTFVFSDTFELLFHRAGVLTVEDVDSLVALVLGAENG